MNKSKHKTTSTVAYTGVIPKTPIRFLLHVTKPHSWPAFIAISMVTLGMIAELLQVYAISQLIDSFTTATDKAGQLAVLWHWGLIFFVLTVLGTVFWRLSGFSGINWIIRANATAYQKLYNYIANHSHSYFINRFAGALSNKISNASDGGLRLIDQTLWRIWPEIISLVVTVGMFFMIHWSVGSVTLLVIILVFFFNVWRVKYRRPYVVAYSAASSKLRGEGVDLLTNMGAVRQYARRTSELERIQGVIDDRVQKDFKQWYMGEWTMVYNGIFGIMLMLMMLLVSYVLLQSGQATAGNLVLVLMLLQRVSFTFNVMGMFMNAFIRMYGETEEGLDEVLIDYEITDAAHAKKLVAEQGEISWQKVGFEFGDNTVFKDFDLEIRAGQRVGLVGHSGAGKTTFVSLLLRQHDLTDGHVYIDGQDISKVTQDSLREAIAVVPQEPMLFHRTIRENIAYGKPSATTKEIEEVAKKAQAHEFICSLEKGYETLVGERGVKLSGGQKQRIAIARAMLKDAPILVLDEATSALDSESEVLIQKALQELMKGKTVIAVAHRLSTLRKMDRILVLDNGKIIEDGTHDQLAASEGIYQRLWEHQAGGFLQD